MADDGSVPVQHLQARRRKSGGKAWLIRDNHFHELDEAADALFLACDGSRTVAQIAEDLVARGLLDAEDARDAARDTLDHFHALGIIRWT
jgi:hypothetical protein